MEHIPGWALGLAVLVLFGYFEHKCDKLAEQIADLRTVMRERGLLNNYNI